MDSFPYKPHAYQDRYVAYIDILGFKNLVDASIHDRPLFNTLRSILSSSIKNISNVNIQIHQFSDSIIISAKHDNEGLNNIIKSLSSICEFLLIQYILTRGALTKGKLYSDDRSVFGPALIKAYQLECDTAVYPRILIDKSIYNELKTISCHQIYCRRDFDSRFHLDILKLGPSIEGDLAGVPIGKGKSLNIALTKEEWLNNIKKFIEEELKKSTGDIQQKFVWLAMYFNSFLKSSKNYNISIIKLKELRNIVN